MTETAPKSPELPELSIDEAAKKIAEITLKHGYSMSPKTIFEMGKGSVYRSDVEEMERIMDRVKNATRDDILKAADRIVSEEWGSIPGGPI